MRAWVGLVAGLYFEFEPEASFVVTAGVQVVACVGVLVEPGPVVLFGPQAGADRLTEAAEV